MATRTAARHFRKYWKRYVFGLGVYTLVSNIVIKRYRDKVIIRHLCSDVSGRGKQRHPATENLKKAYVFLNPTANNGDAKGKFQKFAAPILNLAEFEVVLIESEYSGQIRTLMGYIDPKTDIVVAAGGDGTLFEIVNGLMRRYDANRFMNSVRIGIIPLGKENRFFNKLFPGQTTKLPSRMIGEATKKVMEGDNCPMSVMRLCPKEGNTLYALQQASWGAFIHAYDRKDKFRIFGPLRSAISHAYTAARAWPEDYELLIAANSQDSNFQLWDTLGFDMNLKDNEFFFNIWPNSVTKWDFIKHGWHIGKHKTSPCTATTISKQSCVLTPKSSKETWLSIDGELYEATAIEASVLPNCLKFIAR